MKKTLLILALHLAANGTDAYLTHRNMIGIQPHEVNPIARPFVTRGTPMLVAFFSTATGVELLGTYELNKHGHPRAALLWEAGNTGSHIWGSVVSASGFREPARVTSQVPATPLSQQPRPE